jgi:hypothetical protein
MISKYDKKKVLSIHDDFPSDILVEIMRPYLYLYYINKYSFMKNKIESSYCELHYKLHQFIKFNPTFGRKYIKYNSFTKKRVVEFNDKHINYNSITKVDFNNSHIDPYQENEFAGDIGIFEDDDDDDDEYEPVSHYDSSNNLSVNFRSTILTAFNLEIDFNNISINDNTIEDGEEDEEEDEEEESEEDYDY